MFFQRSIIKQKVNNNNILIYYKPTCMLSRRARNFLIKQGISFKERNISRYPLTEEDLRKLMLGHSAEEFISKKCKKYRELNLENEYMTGDEMVKIIAQEPSLLKKPIIVKGDDIIIGYTRKRAETYFQNHS